MSDMSDMAAVQAAVVPKHAPKDAVWQALSGGRSNASWVIQAKQPIVCKLYRPARSNVMFPNQASAEALALAALEGEDIAPTLIGADVCAAGEFILYTHVPGKPVAPTGAAYTRAAKHLRKLHGRKVPQGLRSLSADPAKILEQGRGLIADLRTAEAQILRGLTPDLPGPSRAEPVFLHGDAVPANMIDGPQGIRLIDWQCPAMGDPVEDIATFLSPGMQTLYGDGPLDGGLRYAFLNEYDDKRTVGRYRRRAPLLHWRLACYCLWMAEQGEDEYGMAAYAEIRRVEELAQLS